MDFQLAALESSLSLVTGSRPEAKGFLQVKTNGIHLWRKPDSVYCELRGTWLTVFTHDGSEHSSFNKHLPFPLSPRHLLSSPRSNHKCSEGNKQDFMEDTDPEAFQVRNAKIVGNEKKFQIIVKPENERGIVLMIPSEEPDEYGYWLKALEKMNQVEATTRLKDFEVITTIGKGGCAKVYKVKHKTTQEVFALKVVEKSSMGKEFKKQHLIDERKILEVGDSHPFILSLRYAFQTRRKLYMVSEYCPNGDLFKYMIALQEALPESFARRVGAEVLLGLEHLHGHGAIYRDLKLENIFIDADGHVRLADFGLSKIIATSVSDRMRMFTGARSFCGTRQYIAPEMIMRKPDYGQAIDLWSFGVVLYEVVTGSSPFYHDSENKIFESICQGKVHLPEKYSPEFRSLIEGLLTVNPRRRLGCGVGGIAEVKTHPWFNGVDWKQVARKESHKDNLLARKNMVQDFDDGDDASLQDEKPKRILTNFLHRFSGARLNNIVGYSFDASDAVDGDRPPTLPDPLEKSFGTFLEDDDDIPLSPQARDVRGFEGKASYSTIHAWTSNVSSTSPPSSPHFTCPRSM